MARIDVHIYVKFLESVQEKFKTTVKVENTSSRMPFELK